MRRGHRVASDYIGLHRISLHVCTYMYVCMYAMYVTYVYYVCMYMTYITYIDIHIHAYIYMHTYTCIHIHAYLYIHKWTYIYMHLHAYLYMHSIWSCIGCSERLLRPVFGACFLSGARMHACTCICICLCMHSYACICMCIGICMHAYACMCMHMYACMHSTHRIWSMSLHRSPQADVWDNQLFRLPSCARGPPNVFAAE